MKIKGVRVIIILWTPLEIKNFSGITKINMDIPKEKISNGVEEKKFNLFPKGVDEDENRFYNLSREKEAEKKQDNLKNVLTPPLLTEKKEQIIPVFIKPSQQKEDLDYMHTMRTDTQKYVEDKDLSLINIFSKESKRASKKFEEEIKFKVSFFVWFIIIAVLISIAGFLGYKTLFGGKIKNESKTLIPSSFIFSDRLEPIYLTDSNFENLVSKINQKFKDSYPLNNFMYFPIILNNAVISSKDFLGILKINIPQELLKSLNKDFIFVIYSDDKGANHSVLGLKLNSYEGAFKAMFEWENEILEELQPIIISSKNDIILRKPEFTDKVVSNIDARVLETSEGKFLIIYGFFGRQYLLITDSEEALKKSIERLKISLSE